MASIYCLLGALVFFIACVVAIAIYGMRHFKRELEYADMVQDGGFLGDLQS